MDQEKEKRMAELRAKFNTKILEIRKKVTVDTILYDIAVSDGDEPMIKKYLYAKQQD